MLNNTEKRYFINVYLKPDKEDWERLETIVKKSDVGRFWSGPFLPSGNIEFDLVGHSKELYIWFEETDMIYSQFEIYDKKLFSKFLKNLIEHEFIVSSTKAYR